MRQRKCAVEIRTKKASSMTYLAKSVDVKSHRLTDLASVFPRNSIALVLESVVIFLAGIAIRRNGRTRELTAAAVGVAAADAELRFGLRCECRKRRVTEHGQIVDVRRRRLILIRSVQVGERWRWHRRVVGATRDVRRLCVVGNVVGCWLHAPCHRVLGRGAVCGVLLVGVHVHIGEWRAIKVGEEDVVGERVDGSTAAAAAERVVVGRIDRVAEDAGVAVVADEPLGRRRRGGGKVGAAAEGVKGVARERRRRWRRCAR